MPFTEVYTALEQKTIDGQENPFTVIDRATSSTRCRSTSPSRATSTTRRSMMISKKTWDRLNEDEQQVLLAAAKEAQVYQRKVSRDAQDKALAEPEEDDGGTPSCRRRRWRRSARS